MPIKKLAFIGLITLCLSAPSHAEDDKGTATGGATITTEVWRVRDPEVARSIEAQLTQAPTDAATVHRLVANAKGPRRVSRFVTSTKFEETTRHSDVVERPFTTSSKKTGGSISGGFGGFVSSGTKLALTATQPHPKSVQVRIEVESSSSGQIRQLPGGTMIPGDRFKIAIKGMFASQSDDAAMVLVFVTATRL